MTNFLKPLLKGLLLPVFCCLLSAAGTPLAAQGCNPDVTPPTAVCVEFTTIALGANGTAVLEAADIDDGSYDNCCLDASTLRRQSDGPCDADGDPDAFASSITVCCADLGAPIVVELRVSDCAGNTNLCLVNVEVVDKTDPTCPSNVTVNCDNFDPTFAAYGPSDNCCMDTVISLSVNYSQFDTLCHKGVIARSFKAVDCSGETSICNQTINVTNNQYYFIKFPNDTITTEGLTGGPYGEPIIGEGACELIGLSFEDQVFVDPNSEMRLERTWTVINWCTYDPNLPVTVVPNPQPNSNPSHPANMPGPIVSEAGSAAPWIPTIVKVNANDPAPTDYSTFWAANANGYKYTQHISTTYFVGVAGTVFSDTSGNCAYNAGEIKLGAWRVKAESQVTGRTWEVQTDDQGFYSLNSIGTDSIIEVTVISAANLGQNCPTSYTVHISPGQTVTQDFPLQLDDQCALMSVGLAAPRLRRCFPNYYAVQACNLSAGTIEDASVEVTLDDYFVFDGSSIPGTLLSGQTYSFPVGDLASGECVHFDIYFTLSCDAPLGATHCTDARILPYDDCDGENSNWSGSDVTVEGECQGDSLRFAIRNRGTGDMTQTLDFVVVEDVIMRQAGNYKLNQGEALSFSVPATGGTWRVEAEQESAHPWGGRPAIAIEGCGGWNTLGLVNAFSLSDPNPFYARDCMENIGAFDPNDKMGIPVGYGNEHLIEANTDLEYLIRFQNTGTDTAFNVVVLDTLAQALNAATVRVESASHPMEFSVLEGGIMRFSFNNIMLPDSNINQLGSNGFVKFRVSQQPDLPLGTRIENRAAIYFDFNEPVITNTTFHTIGDHIIITEVDEALNSSLLRAYPNPGSDLVNFELKNYLKNARFELRNNLGQVLRNTAFEGNTFRFERGQMPAGIYMFQISADNTKVAAGKLILK